MLEIGDTLPTLETERLTIRWMVSSDAPAVFDIFRNPETMRYWSRTAMTDVAEAAELIDEIGRHLRERDLFEWGYTRRGDRRVIGTCTLAHLDLVHRRAEIGYSLNRELWGQGYAQEAVTAVLDFAFDKLELHRIEADVDPRNLRSLRVLDRLGFTREGYLPERYRVGGELQDTVFYGLLAPTWKRRSAGVRPMTRADRDRVLDMLYTQLTEHDVAIERSTLARAIDGVFDQPHRGAFLVADLGQGPIGVAYLGFTWTLELGGLVSWLEELYVVPEHRGRGIGEALLSSAIAHAKTHGALGMDLEVETGHERAANLYQRAGFRRLTRTRWQKALT